MNLNPLMMEIQKKLNIPVEPDLYKGNEDIYITFTYQDERAIEYGDDEEEYVQVSLYISLYCPSEMNYMDLKKELKKALKEQGFQLRSIQSYLVNDEVGGDYYRRVLFDVNYTELDN